MSSRAGGGGGGFLGFGGGGGGAGGGGGGGGAPRPGPLRREPLQVGHEVVTQWHYEVALHSAEATLEAHQTHAYPRPKTRSRMAFAAFSRVLATRKPASSSTLANISAG